MRTRGWPLEMRLERLLVPEPNSGCWLWLGGVGRGGYGLIKVHGKARMAHRVMYELRRGPIPDGLVLDHLCRTPCCVNPDHLEPVTERENILRGRGLAADNARKEFCAHGHPLDVERTYAASGGLRTGRQCRTCLRRAGRDYWARKQARKREAGLG